MFIVTSQLPHLSGKYIARNKQKWPHRYSCARRSRTEFETRMEFKFPKLPNVGTGGNGRESPGFGGLTPRSVLSAISKSIVDNRLDYPYSDPTLDGFSGYEINTASTALFSPMGRSESAIKKIPVVDSQFSVENQGLGQVYAKLSRLELDQRTSLTPNYKMLKRAPKKPPRKPFDISSYAKNFMSSVADVPRLRRSRTNVVKDFTLGGHLLNTSSEGRTPLNFTKVTSVPLSDLLQNPSKPHNTLPVPTPSPSEQGKLLLPEMRRKVKKASHPTFASKSVPHFKNAPSSSLLRQLNIEIPVKKSDRDTNWACLKLTKNSSIRNIRMCKSEARCDATERYYDVKDEKIAKRLPRIILNQNLPKSVEKSYRTLENEVDRQFLKRRKIENARCHLLKKMQLTDGALQAASHAKRSDVMPPSVPEILPPISSNYLLISQSNLSACSFHNPRKPKGATDADDELDSSTSFNNDRIKRHRRQPQCYSSGSETEDLNRYRAAKRRKKRKRTDVFSTVTIEDHIKSQAVKDIPLQIKRQENQGRRGAGDETTDIRRTTPISSPDQDLRNTSERENSEGIISRYINDLARRGNIATSDPEDGDDELEDDDDDFSYVSMT